MRKLMISGLVATLAITCLPSIEAFTPDYEKEARERKAKAEQVRKAAKARNLTERETVLEVEESVRKYSKTLEKRKLPYQDGMGISSFNSDDYKLFIEYGEQLNVLVGLRDKQSRSLLEEMAMSKDEWVCVTGIGGYVMLAGQVNSLSFVDKIINMRGFPMTKWHICEHVLRILRS